MTLKLQNLRLLCAAALAVGIGVPYTAGGWAETSSTVETSATEQASFASHPVLAALDAQASSTAEGEAVLPRDWGDSPPGQWNSNEFTQLAVPPAEAGDPLARLPDGAVVTPAQPLTAEELLGANREEVPISYRETADIMNVSEANVKVLIFRARQAVKNQIDKIENYGL